MKYIFPMIFLHIIDDYFIQSACLNFLKQKSWWEKNTTDSKYKYDYIPALLAHAYSWAFMVMLPYLINCNFVINRQYILALLTNCGIHAYVDNLKANKLKINLITDQLIHLAQIITTALLLTI